MILVRVSAALHFLSLALWVGGLAAIGGIVAPLAFRSGLTEEHAGNVVGGSLRAFGKIEIACAVVALLSAVICQAVGVWAGRIRWPRILGIVAMAALTLVYTQAFYPPMEDLRPLRRAGDPVATAEFDRLHGVSANLVKANLLLGLTVLGVSAATIRSAEGS